MGKFRKLGRHAAHRVSMLRTMVSQLVKHERIETTVAKAKEVRRKADQMVQLGKDGTLDAARRASAFVRGDDVVHKLFTELAYRYKTFHPAFADVVSNMFPVQLVVCFCLDCKCLLFPYKMENLLIRNTYFCYGGIAAI
ncbi:50S ribosomal protein L17 [Triticum urartu]|uniref:50S ribosomal protein L17 n=2 Tax=Triticum TaxID=4564 RepID=A0A9R0RS58_TRITD|nr:50S ribosomal protein L17 [Triticum urartu]VAH65778.1 unnamed protein product [Triticum turgidum subsp. durum]